MKELRVKYKGKDVFTFPIDKPEIVIGRLPQSDLILSGDGVSRRHAVLQSQNENIFIEDCSSHGTFLNGKPVSERSLLKSDDVIRILDWEFLFATARPQSEALEQTRKTQIQELIRANDSKSGLKLIEIEERSQILRTYFPLLVIQSASGKTARVIMKKKNLLLGSSPDCDVVIDDAYVSSRHARVSVTDRGFLVEDLQSTNGTWLGGARIQQTYLKDSQKIRVGESDILVSLKSDQTEKIEPVKQGQFCGLIGNSEPMKYLFAKIEKIAATDMTTLVLGETGSGKEMVARAIHDLSARRSGPYVIINCGAISPHLIESELFGHEKGAFTGAEKQHKGVFEQAHQGTLFLDEIGELPLDLQSKVLRVLEYKTLRRVGADAEVRVDVRLIAATHQDLAKRVREQKFREDLFYRLYVLPLEVPSLRQRKQDIPGLVAYFLKTLAPKPIDIDSAALEKLMTHHWPGNVRELKNTILRAIAFCDGQKVRAEDVEVLTVFGQPEKFTKQSLGESEEKDRIVKALTESAGDKNKAAEILGMGRSTLFRKIKQLGVE